MHNTVVQALVNCSPQTEEYVSSKSVFRL